jgi:tetratricopeptide (TPR) repeat protein
LERHEAVAHELRDDSPTFEHALQVNDPSGSREDWPPRDGRVALTGELATIEAALGKREVDAALAKARDWHARAPGDVLALIALGDALEAKGSNVTAARIYGSIIDLFPGRADMRRFAGERLERVAARLAQASGTRDLVTDTYRRAVADRPDHVTGHRLLAYALLRAGHHADAFAAILAGIDRSYPDGRFLGADRVLGEDAGLIGAAYAAAESHKRGDIVAALRKRNLELATAPSTRFILYWETDANDVDFHIQDARGGHAFFGSKVLPSGGELYADITTGYGPECFTIPGKPSAGPYKLSIHYYSQGPMGYGMGLLQVERFDGKGGLTLEDRPYVIMNDHAFVDLGRVP